MARNRPMWLHGQSNQFPTLNSIAAGGRPQAQSDALSRFAVRNPMAKSQPAPGAASYGPYLARAAQQQGIPPAMANIPGLLQRLQAKGLTNQQSVAKQTGTADPAQQAQVLLKNRGRLNVTR